MCINFDGSVMMLCFMIITVARILVTELDALAGENKGIVN